MCVHNDYYSAANVRCVFIIFYHFFYYSDWNEKPEEEQVAIIAQNA